MAKEQNRFFAVTATQSLELKCLAMTVRLLALSQYKPNCKGPHFPMCTMVFVQCISGFEIGLFLPAPMQPEDQLKDLHLLAFFFSLILAPLYSPRFLVIAVLYTFWFCPAAQPCLIVTKGLRQKAK